MSDHKKLSQVEVERLVGIYRELNQEIRWGRVIDDVLESLLVDMERVLFLGPGRGGGKPIDKVFEWEKSYMMNSAEKKRLVLLYLTRKLLGGLKTRVRQETGALLLSNENTSGAREEEDEREQVVAANLLRESPPKIPSDLRKPESSTNCHHTRTTTIYQEKEGQVWLQERCKDCRQSIRQEKTENRFHSGQEQALSEKATKACSHPRASWIPGKEGQEAQCVACGFAPVPDVAKYRWEECGLEPVGDDPSKDELIDLEQTMGYNQ